MATSTTDDRTTRMGGHKETTRGLLSKQSAPSGRLRNCPLLVYPLAPVRFFFALSLGLFLQILANRSQAVHGPCAFLCARSLWSLGGGRGRIQMGGGLRRLRRFAAKIRELPSVPCTIWEQEVPRWVPIGSEWTQTWSGGLIIIAGRAIPCFKTLVN